MCIGTVAQGGLAPLAKPRHPPDGSRRRAGRVAIREGGAAASTGVRERQNRAAYFARRLRPARTTAMVPIRSSVAGSGTAASGTAKRIGSLSACVRSVYH